MWSAPSNPAIQKDANGLAEPAWALRMSVLVVMAEVPVAVSAAVSLAPSLMDSATGTDRDGGYPSVSRPLAPMYLPATGPRTPCGAAEVTRQAVAELGRTLLLVPHPDDETTGCGGLLALLGRAGAAVQVVLLTDGAGSHRHSRKYPATRLRALRQREMTAALRELGHSPQRLLPLGLPDGGVPTRGEPGFDAVVSRLAWITRGFRPHTVLMPTRDDAHPDHRATCAAGAAACLIAAPEARRLEYPIWGGSDADRSVWQLDIASVIDEKRRALARHRSQLGQVVHGDPQGFILPPDLLARCTRVVEVYFLASGGHPDVYE